MTLEGVDYSDARPGGANIAKQGKRFVVRYLYPVAAGGKGLSAPEVVDLHSAGLELVLVYEGGNAGMMKGHAQGVADAKAAQALLDALPLDHRMPIHFAVDWDAVASDLAPIEGYLDGAASVLGMDRTGVYGSFFVIEHVASVRMASFFWQTYAWSGGRVSGHATLLQYANGQWNGTVDFCRALQTEYGQHAPTIATPTNSEEETMFVIFKGDHAPECYALVSGKKRHITPEEAHIISLAGEWHVTVVPQAAADAIAAV